MSVGGKLLLRFVLLQSIVVVAFSSCICPVAHPQQHFCKHEYVLKIRIDKINEDLPDVYRYDVDIQRVYKGNISKLIIRSGRAWLSLPANCSFKDVATDQRYIIFGSYNNGALRIGRCSGSWLWLGYLGRKLNQNYRKGCTCMDLDQFKSINYDLCKWDYSYIKVKLNGDCVWAKPTDYKRCIRKHGPQLF